ncbi:MAG: hypothetical protein NVS4B12_19150 [Ktedonobacteraceae bacterium]
MRRTVLLTMLLCGVLIALTACGFTQSNSNAHSTIAVAPQGENLYVLDGYTSTNPGGQRIVSFHPGTSTFTSLPTGLISQNHQYIYTAIPQNGQTKITVTNSRSGAVVHSFTIAGIYATPGNDYTNAVLSSNGHWLALRQLGQMEAKSTFAFVDTQKGNLVKTFSLPGNFDLDAVSPDGSRVYLLERLHDTTGHYYVRRYDVGSNELFQTIIADKEEINDPRMIGSALTRQMAEDGSRAYTLYTDTHSNIAFVHILPLASSFNGARCIDLPAGKSADLLHYYTLALSSDGSTLYATNAALGVMVVINVSDKDAFSDDIQTTVHFRPTNVSVTHDERMRTLYNGAALSTDQSTLYVTDIRGVVAINIANANIKQSYAQQQIFTGIALSTDGQTLYAVSPSDGITLVNIHSGHTQQITQSPAHSPWGIEWVSKQ